MFRILQNRLKQQKDVKEQMMCLEIRRFLIGFYEAKEKQTDDIDLPAHILAEQVLDEIKAEKKIQEYYKKLQSHKLVA